MIFRFLGTGTSGGVPLISCDCDVCNSLDFRDKRLRSSLLITHLNKNYIIDCGPDFRQQALAAKLKSLEAILFTHEHKDHTGGLDDIRPLNYLHGKKSIPIYAEKRVIEQIKTEYHYAFNNDAYSGIPLIDTRFISNNENIKFDDIEFDPIQVMHHKLPVLGFRIKDFAYITDANYIENKEKEKLKNLEILVLNALQTTKHLSHFTLEEALEIIEELKPQKTYLTHISHKMGKHAEISKILPENVFLAFDQLELELDD